MSFISAELVPDERGRKPAGRRWTSGLAAVWVLLCAGVLVEAGLLRSGEAKALDAHWFYVAGLCWRAGESPYDPDRFSQVWRDTFHSEPLGSFAYPPTLGAIAIPISFAPWAVARLAFPAVALVGFATMIALVARLTNGPDWFRSARVWFWLGASCLVSSVASTLFIGQCSLVALAGAVAALYFGASRRVWAAAIALVFATVKPQVSLFLVVFLLGAGGFLPLVAGAAASLAIAAAVVRPTPWRDLVEQIRASVQSLAAHPAEQADQFANLPSVVGLNVSLALLTGVAVALVVGVGRRSSPLRPSGMDRVQTAGLQLALAAGPLVTPLHDYDLVPYAALLVSLAATPVRWTLGFLAPLAAVSRPNVATRIAGAAGLDLEPRSVVLGGALALFLLACTRWIQADRERARSEAKGLAGHRA